MASASEVAARLIRWKATGSEVSVVINADRSVEHGEVVEVMDAIRQGGVTRIAIAVKPRTPYFLSFCRCQRVSVFVPPYYRQTLA